MNSEDETLSTKDESPEKFGVKTFSVNITVRTPIYDFLDKCFQLVDFSWEQFVQQVIDDIIDSMATGCIDDLGERFSNKFSEIYEGVGGKK